jgi:histidine ammonia-lyase
MNLIKLNGENLDIYTFNNVVRNHALVGVEQDSIEKVNMAQAYVKQVVESGVPTYYRRI